MKVLGSRNGENIPNLEVVGVVLVQCDSVDNKYQQKSEVLHDFAPNKSYAYLLNDLTDKYKSSNLDQEIAC